MITVRIDTSYALNWNAIALRVLAWDDSVVHLFQTAEGLPSLF